MCALEGRIAAAGSICLLLALVGSASGDEIRVESPDEFCVNLATPAGFKPFAGSEMPHCFGGVLIAAWEKDTPHGTGIIYVVAKRRQGQVLIGHITSSLEQYLQQAPIVHETQLDEVFLMGRPAARFTMTGQGTGQIISALSEKHPGDKATYMEIVLTTNLWSEGAGTDFFLFVMGCPQSAKADMVVSFQSVLDASKLTGQHTPTGPGQPSSDKPIAPGGASMASGGRDVISGLLRTEGSKPAHAISIQLLWPQRHGINIRWQTGTEDNADVYVCVWPDMRAAWVIPGADFRRLARKADELYELSYTEELAPYLGRWDYLWPTEGD